MGNTDSLPCNLDIHGPFPSYGDQKFVAVLTDEATKIPSFMAMAGKTTEDLATACFVEWICKLSVPQVIDTNLSEDQTEGLKEELDTCLNQEPVHQRQSRFMLHPKSCR